MNPSNWTQRVVLALLALPPMIFAIYMGLYEWKLIGYVWDPVFGTGTMDVLNSDLSHQITSWIRIPDAILGAIAYLADVVLALAGSDRRWQDRPWLVMIFGINFVPLSIVSALLVFMQGLVVKHYCFLCIVSACISVVLALLSYKEVLFSLEYLKRVWKRSKSLKVVWLTFWGSPSQVAYEIGEEMCGVESSK